MIWLLATLLALQARDAPAAARGAAPGTAVIAGVVSSTERGQQRALRSATVTITGAGLTSPRTVSTDENGRFQFGRLAAGTFSITVEKPGYLKAYAGSRVAGRPPGAVYALADGQQMTGLIVDVAKGAAIEGTLRNEFGAPIASGQVAALRIMDSGGVRRYASPRGGLSQATTDDRGHYRLYGLPPGDYAIRGSGNSGAIGAQRVSSADVEAADAAVAGTTAPPAGAAANRADAPPLRLARAVSYFPNVSDVSIAQVVTLAPGDERTDIDLVNQPVPTFAVSVQPVSPHGEPLQDFQIGIANLSTQSLWTSPGGVPIAPGDGRGKAGFLPRGRYLFFGRAADTAGRAYWAATEVVVDSGDVVDAPLPFQSAQRVSGRVEAADGAANHSGVRVSLESIPPVPGMPVVTPSGVVGADGAFVVTGVPAGRYRVSVESTPGTSAASAIVDGRDVLDLPLDVRPGEDVGGMVVTLARGTSEISGHVTDASGRATPEYSVIVVSAERAFWGIARRRLGGPVRIAADGAFHVSGLPAGEYGIAVLADVDADDLEDPSFLEQVFAASMRLRVATGQRIVQDLKVGG